ncbi:MAG: GDSL-type esterase/lipase family protein, partial [Rhizomicrobium sp.]
GPGNFSGQLELTGAAPVAEVSHQGTPYLFLTGVDVFNPRGQGVIVVLGTTRTAGTGHWPQFLAQRLRQQGFRISVVNASAVANALLWPFPGAGEAGLARFDRDVLLQPGITHAVIADAINDIGQPGVGPAGHPTIARLPSLQQLESAYLQLAARARARGVKVIAATVMPFQGVPFPHYYSPAKEQLRVALNRWIRDNRAFDAVIDLDAIVRDPADPARFRPGLHQPNNFAPNSAGEHRIANAINLNLFR